MPRHKDGTKRADELTFNEMAKAVTATINNLAALIRLHVRTSPKPTETREKFQRQINRMLSRI